MDPGPSHNRNEPTKEGSGNMTPDVRYYEDLNRNTRPRQIRGRGFMEGAGSSTSYQDPSDLTFRQQQPRQEARNSGKFPY
jgi:hypothetical protein